MKSIVCLQFHFKVGICLHLADVPLVSGTGNYLGLNSTTSGSGLQAYYSESQRGNTHLIDQNGYHYRMDKKHPRDNSITWRCKSEWKFKCKARAKTVDGIIITGYGIIAPTCCRPLIERCIIQKCTIVQTCKLYIVHTKKRKKQS